MPLGLYISVPFCRTKCSYCNFASDVFSRAVFERYVERVAYDIRRASETAKTMGGRFEPIVDSIFLGGGTPTILDINQLERLFVSISQNFALQPEAEVTVECAPGTLSPEMIEALQRCKVNRVSLGVQSFVDIEAASVGRLHKRATVFDDIARLRAAGIEEINVDLIAGLPHQTRESWELSLAEAIASNVPHVSVYMLEVDDDSRLGREVMAGGARYHAHFVPDEGLTADMYEMACERLNAADVQQYEISNFARDGHQSRHNLKYWTRQPYLGFGVDAHSMLHRSESANEAVRFAAPDSLEEYVAGGPYNRTPVPSSSALEETFFLGLRLNQGVDLKKVASDFGEQAVDTFSETIAECEDLGLLKRDGDVVRLTPRGRLLSNEVFERFILCGADTPVHRL
jgi:oxygen-independent coproporphyrinogen-3 oxidase